MDRTRRHVALVVQPRPPPAVRLESFDDPQLLTAAESLRAIGRRLYLLDCTTDFGIPVYVSVAPRLDGSGLLFASAAHPSPRVAAWKAASEAAQVWTTAQTTGRLPDSLRPGSCGDPRHAALPGAHGKSTRRPSRRRSPPSRKLN